MAHQAEVVYMSSSFWLLDVGSSNLSKAEKEITAWKAEKNNKMTITIFVCFKGSRRWYFYFAWRIKSVFAQFPKCCEPNLWTPLKGGI